MKKSVGEMNGPWELSLKIFLTTWPMALLFNAWVVKSIFDHDKRIDQRSEASAKEHVILRAEIESNMKAYHDRDMKERGMR